MTDITFVGACAPEPRVLPKQGDFVLFGVADLFFVVRYNISGGQEEDQGLKFISMEDGNRHSDGFSLEKQIEDLEKNYGKMRIVRKAEISLTF